MPTLKARQKLLSLVVLMTVLWL